MIPYLQKEVINFKHAKGGIFIPSTSQKPSTTNSFAPAIDPTITPELMEKKVIKDLFYVRNCYLMKNIKLMINLENSVTEMRVNDKVKYMVCTLNKGANN